MPRHDLAGTTSESSHRFRTLRTGLAVAIAAFGLAASTSFVSAGASTTNVSKGVAEAESAVKSASASAFWAPPSFTVAHAKGKTVWWIADESSNIIVQWADYANQAFTKEGVTVHLDDPGQTESGHIQAFQLAIAAKPAAIVLADGNPAVEFEAQIAQAKAAGIPVFSLVSHPLPKGSAPVVPGLVNDISYSYPRVGVLLADWFVADSKGKGDALLIDLGGIPSSEWELDGFKQEVKRLNTDVKYQEVSAPYQTEQQVIPSQVRSALLANKNIDYVLPPFDSMALIAQPAIVQAGDASKVKTAGFNTIIPQMENLKAGNTPFAMDIGGPNNWESYAVVDDVLRYWNNQPQIYDPQIGLKIFTHSNVQDLTVTSEDDNQWYGINYPEKYNAIWKS